MTLTSGSLVPFLVAVAFAAGLNLYATTVTLGLLGRLHLVALPPGLEVLSHPWALWVGGALFCLEVFADKIPFADLLWNFAHTFVRIPVAALLAYRASAQLGPAEQAAVVLLAGVVAAVAHGGKTAARTAVTMSPEPVSNVLLSSAEDAIAVALTWLATKHPYGAAAGVGCALLAAGFGVRWVARGMRKSLGRLRGRWAGSALPRPEAGELF